ncbi:MAG: hypothetical protein FK732_00860, partial [Asgard group archaeon]|nr:hypothetical protein [Asgard group archaeon]
MNERMTPYVSFTRKIDSALDELKQSKKFGGIASIDEFKDLNIAISAFQETIESIESGKSAVNHASLYDRTLSIRDISSNFATSSTIQILNEANETLALASKQQTFGETNSHLLNYYSVMSDMKFVSETMSEVCGQIRRNGDKGLTSLDEFANTLDNSVNGILLKSKEIFGSVGKGLKGIFQSFIERFKKAFKGMVRFLKNKVLDKLIGAIKKAAEALDKLKLWMLKSMFRFIGEVAKLAKENGWNVKEINVEMPDIGVKLEKLGNIPIP